MFHSLRKTYSFFLFKCSKSNFFLKCLDPLRVYLVLPAGNCTCDSNFAGSDCSFDVSGPPNITHVSGFGFCDKSSEPCDEITLFGKYFIEKMNTKCNIKRTTVRFHKFEVPFKNL